MSSPTSPLPLAAMATAAAVFLTVLYLSSPTPPATSALFHTPTTTSAQTRPLLHTPPHSAPHVLQRGEQVRVGAALGDAEGVPVEKVEGQATNSTTTITQSVREWTGLVVGLVLMWVYALTRRRHRADRVLHRSENNRQYQTMVSVSAEPVLRPGQNPTPQLKDQSSFTNTDADVVIVGGGPSGLASALSLAKQGVKNIAVLESKVDYVQMDWVKSYCYRIDGHGMKWIRGMGLEEKFKKAACHNPEQLTVMQPDGSSKQVGSIMKDVYQETFWLWRNDLLQFLYKQTQELYPDAITVHFSTKCASLDRLPTEDNQYAVEVVAVEELAGGANTVTLRPRLVMGSEGVRSLVRDRMEQWDPKFALREIPHVSTGLPFKALNLTLPDSQAPTGSFVIMKGENKESLGVFPQRSDRVRLVGCVRQPGHPLMKITDPEELVTYLQGNWPQINWDEALTPESAQAFVSGTPSYFPSITYCEDFQTTMPSKPHEQLGASSGLCIIGDALHCFPPDLGQGVNAAFEDVYVFEQALKEAGNDLSKALPLYEAKRRADAHAIAHLLPIGVPYQYPLPNTPKKFFWYVDFLARTLGHKAFPFAINQPIAFDLQDPKYDYSILLQKHRDTTRTFQAAFLAAVSTAALLYKAQVGLAVGLGILAAAVLGMALAIGAAMKRGVAKGYA